MAEKGAMTADHWLRITTAGACFAVAFVGTRVVAFAPYARKILRELGTHDVRKARHLVLAFVTAKGNA
jgi:hypothetical protein